MAIPIAYTEVVEVLGVLVALVVAAIHQDLAPVVGHVDDVVEVPARLLCIAAGVVVCARMGDVPLVRVAAPCNDKNKGRYQISSRF